MGQKARPLKFKELLKKNPVALTRTMAPGDVFTPPTGQQGQPPVPARDHRSPFLSRSPFWRLPLFNAPQYHSLRPAGGPAQHGREARGAGAASRANLYAAHIAECCFKLLARQSRSELCDGGRSCPESNFIGCHGPPASHRPVTVTGTVVPPQGQFSGPSSETVPIHGSRSE